MAAITAAAMRRDLRGRADSQIATHSARFFKTGIGEYGEGDRFLGIRVPVLRKQAARYRLAPLRAVLATLRSPYHEERLFAILLLVEQYERGDAETRERVFTFYLDHRAWVNNWDLVDSSAYKIIGPYLQDKSRDLLYELARSQILWDRRIAMIASLHYIRQHDFTDALRLAQILRNDEHDLMHKAVGWMLREIGKRDLPAEEDFLQANYRQMPRTMLRYAIERLPARRRKAYLHGSV
ncbi:MAG: DNA alkylation repair protein [Woeseiaceae bacterium]